MAGEGKSSDARIRACNDIYNFISHACTTFYILGVFSRNAVDPANIWSVDEFAVTLNKVGAAPKVTTTKETKKAMAQKKRPIKNPHKSSGFQAKADLAKVTITLGINPTGQVAAAMYAIREGDFKLKSSKDEEWDFVNFSIQVCTQCSLVPRPSFLAMLLPKSNPCCSVPTPLPYIQDSMVPVKKIRFMIIPQSTTEQEEHNEIMAFFLDAACTARDDWQEARERHSQSQSSQDDEGEVSEVAPPARCVVLLDGAVPQMKYLQKQEVVEEYKDKNVSACKSPASTTGTMAANDVMKGHGNYRTRAHSQKERDSALPPESKWPKYVKRIRDKLAKHASSLTEKSIKHLLKHFCHLHEFFARTLSLNTVKGGFVDVGLWPFDAAKMLAQCDSWGEFPPDQQRKIEAVIPKLAAKISANGAVTDEMIQKELPFLEPPPADKSTVPKDSRQPSHRRSLLFLDGNYSLWKEADDARKVRQAVATAKSRADAEAAKSSKAVAKRVAEEKKKEKLREAAQILKKKKSDDTAASRAEKFKKAAIKKRAKLLTKARNQSKEARRLGEEYEGDWICKLCRVSWKICSFLGLIVEDDEDDDADDDDDDDEEEEEVKEVKEEEEEDGEEEVQEEEGGGGKWLEGTCGCRFCPDCVTSEETVDNHAANCSPVKKRKRKRR